MRLPGIVLVALSCVLTACRGDPKADFQSVVRAVETGDTATIEKHLHPNYSDPIGDKTKLLSDLRSLKETYPRIAIRVANLENVPGANPAVSVSVQGEIDIRLTGSPSLKLTGPINAEYQQSSGWRLRSGLLVHLRDVIRLMEARRAALEGNDPEAYATLLHPQYRDGDLDLAEVTERLKSDLTGVRVRHRPTHYRIEVRGPLTHVDERFTLEVAGKTHHSVARLTLKPVAGRWRIAGGLYRSP